MARKRTKPQPDAVGYLSTGIYKRYVGEPKPEHRLTPDRAKALVDALNTPVSADLARIRAGLHAIITPFVDGPLLEQEANRPLGRTVYVLDFGDGLKLYRAIEDLERQDQCAIDQFRDAVEAMNETRLIELHLGPDGKVEWLFRAAYQLGRLCERIGVRPFEHAAKVGRAKIRKSALNARRTNEKRARRRPDYRTAVKKQMEYGVKYDPACQAVADEFDVTKETVRNNTPDLRPRKPKRK